MARTTAIKIGNTIYTEGISSGTLVLSEMIADSTIVLGKYIANMFEVKLYGTGDVTGQSIEVSQELDDGSINQLFKGTILSSTLDDNGYYRQITAYDDLYFISTKDISSWWTSFWENKTSSTLIDLRQSLLLYVGITEAINSDYLTHNGDTLLYNDNSLIYNYIPKLLHDNLVVNNTVDITQMAFSEMLEMICELQGVIPNMNRYGRLEYITLNNSNVVSIDDNYQTGSSTFEDFTTPVYNGIQLLDAGGNVCCSIGDSNTYTCTTNIFIINKTASEYNEIGNALLNVIKNITYRPCDIALITTDYSLTLGTYIGTSKGKSFVLDNEFRGIQFIEHSIKCNGESTIAETTGSFNTEYAVTDGKIASITTDIDGLHVDLEDLAENTTNKFEVTTQGLEAEIARATEAEGDLKTAISVSAEGVKLEISKEYATQTDLANAIENLQNQIDGSIETFTGDEEPTLENYPANTWNESEYASHVGDLYTGSSTSNISGYWYRFEYDNDSDTYSWQLITDSEITQAIQTANEALSTANSLANTLANDYSTTIDMEKYVDDTADETLKQASSDTESQISEAVTNVTNDITTDITTRLKSYSTTEETKAEITASTENVKSEISKSYATKVELNTATITASDDATTKANNALTSAKSYTDSASETTLTSAYNYTTSEVSEALNSANTYTDSVSSNTLTSANNYTDGKASDTLSSANAYTDSTATTTLNSANNYVVSQLKSYSTTTEMNSAIEQTAESLKSEISQTYTTQAEFEKVIDSTSKTLEADITNALKNANTDTLPILTDYSTTKEINSQFEQTTESINAVISSVDETNVSITNLSKTVNDNLEYIEETYSTKEEVTSALTIATDNIKSEVSKTYTTQEEFNGMTIGARNLILNSKDLSCIQNTFFSAYIVYNSNNLLYNSNILVK